MSAALHLKLFLVSINLDADLTYQPYPSRESTDTFSIRAFLMYGHILYLFE